MDRARRRIEGDDNENFRRVGPRCAVEDCNLSYAPFDVPRTDAVLYNNPLKIMPAWLMFTEFMRFVDAPLTGPIAEPAPVHVCCAAA